MRFARQRAVDAAGGQVAVAVLGVGVDLVQEQVDPRLLVLLALVGPVGGDEDVAHPRASGDLHQPLLQCGGDGGDGQRVAHWFSSFKRRRYSSRLIAGCGSVRGAGVGTGGCTARTSIRPMLIFTAGAGASWFSRAVGFSCAPTWTNLPGRLDRQQQLLARDLAARVVVRADICGVTAGLVWLTAGRAGAVSGSSGVFAVPRGLLAAGSLAAPGWVVLWAPRLVSGSAGCPLALQAPPAVGRFRVPGTGTSPARRVMARYSVGYYLAWIREARAAERSHPLRLPRIRLRSAQAGAYSGGTTGRIPLVSPRARCSRRVEITGAHPTNSR